MHKKASLIWRYFVLTTVVFFSGYLYLMQFYLYSPSSNFSNNKKIHIEKNNSYSQGIKKILIWTTYYEFEPLAAVTDYLNEQSQICSFQCEFIADRLSLNISDAVVFHSRYMKRNDFPNIHHQTQRWIYLQQESPIHTKPDLKQFSDVFNWTMTYRKDSDIFHPYGKFIPRTEQVNFKTQTKNIIKKKTKLIAWVVSNCWSKSKREDFAEELKNHIPVDTFGYCGDYDCSKTDCFNFIENNYKFYLSLENSLCSEYVTEKLWNALNRSIVPIVYGRNINYSSIAPKYSYIDAADFKNAKDLATYLYDLDENPEKYAKYFDWKFQYKIIGPQDGWCKLCSLLNSNTDVKWYRDIWSWWHTLNASTFMCVNPMDLNFESVPIFRRIYKAVKIFIGWKSAVT